MKFTPITTLVEWKPIFAPQHGDIVSINGYACRVNLRNEKWPMYLIINRADDISGFDAELNPVRATNLAYSGSK